MRYLCIICIAAILCVLGNSGMARADEAENTFQSLDGQNGHTKAMPLLSPPRFIPLRKTRAMGTQHHDVRITAPVPANIPPVAAPRHNASLPVIWRPSAKPDAQAPASAMSEEKAKQILSIFPTPE